MVGKQLSAELIVALPSGLSEGLREGQRQKKLRAAWTTAYSIPVNRMLPESAQ